MWKRGEIAPKINFSSFPHYFIYIFLTSGVKLHIHLFNVVVQFIVFLTLSTLIFRGMDISSVSVSPLEFEITSQLYLKNTTKTKMDKIKCIVKTTGCFNSTSLNYTNFIREIKNTGSSFHDSLNGSGQSCSFLQYNLKGSNTDGSFTMDNSNLFFSPYKILPIAQKNKYLGIFSYFIMGLYAVCTH